MSGPFRRVVYILLFMVLCLLSVACDEHAGISVVTGADVSETRLKNESKLTEETVSEIPGETVIPTIGLPFHTTTVAPVPHETPSAQMEWTLALPTPETDPPFDQSDRPSSDALDSHVSYSDLMISSFYATGRAAGDAVVGVSYIELYNNSSADIPLAGAALYVSNRGGTYEEYRFAYGDKIPAQGYFLIRGSNARGTHENVFSVNHYDTFLPIRLDADNVRLAIAPAGMTLDIDTAMADLEGLFAYVSSSPTDAADVIHYVGKLSAHKLVRKKATTDQVDYQTIDLTKASWTVLGQITPRTSAGDLNTTVESLIDEVVFSEKSGIYGNAFALTLTAPEGYAVYYTFNGDDPRLGGAMLYKEPIELMATTNMVWGSLTKKAAQYMGGTYYPLAFTFPGTAVIKAYAVNGASGETTPLTTQTYFVGEMYMQWAVDMVSVSLAEDDFFSSDGIYNNASNNGQNPHPHVPAYVEFFSSDVAQSGDGAGQVYAGWSEIAMNGKGSLSMTQKSFRILLKSNVMDTEEVAENLNMLNYDLFGDYATSTPYGERVTWFRHILLRNGGGDMSGSTISRSHIGDAYIQRIDRYLTPQTMSSASVMVFINGEFWGLYNARDRLDPKYFECKYGIAEESFTMLECPHPLIFGWNVDYVTAYGEASEADVFMDMIDFVRNNDMSVDANYQAVAEQIDIDGLIDFFCAQIYLCCSDWPSNNIKIWRNTDPTIMDTKWHFCIVDTDHGCGLNSTVETNLFSVINDVSVLGSLFNHLLEYSDFRAQFIQRFIWCTEVYYAPDRLVAELDAMVEPILPVMQYQLDRWRVTDGTATDWDKWYSYIEVIRDFAKYRPAYAKAQLMAWAGINEKAYQNNLAAAIERWGTDYTQA